MLDLLLQLVIHDGRNNARAKGFRHRDDHTGETACTRLHEKRVAGFDSALQTQEQVSGTIDLRQCRSLHHGQTLGDRHEQTFRNSYIFGVSAAAEQRADLVSDVPFALFFDLAADCLDDARSFQSEIIRPTGRGRILSGALKKIGAVDACGVNFKQDFVVMYLRHGNFGPVQMTVCSVQHCIHRITSCVICGETSPFLQSIHLF